MISTHFEILMYVLGAAFCQLKQIHQIRHMMFSVTEFYDAKKYSTVEMAEPTLKA